MNLLKARIGQIKKLGLPEGRRRHQLQMENGRVVGDDLLAVAAVEKFIAQAEGVQEGHLDSDGPATWYDSWSQKHDRNNWSRDLDENRFRSLRTRELSAENTLVAEARGIPLIPEFASISELVPQSFSAQDSSGYMNLDYKWDDDGRIKSIHERRSFPGQPVEELNLTVNDQGLITLETSVEELRIP